MIKRSEPRLSLATNGIILRWEEREVPDKGLSFNTSCYSDARYMGSQTKLFKFAEKAKAMEEFIAIGIECGECSGEDEKKSS